MNAGSKVEVAPRWSGTVRIESGWALFRGRAGDQAPHRHHAVQLVFGDTPVTVHLRGGALLRGRALAIPADCEHCLQVAPTPLSLLYLDRESSRGAALDAWCAGQARELEFADPALVRCGIEALMDHASPETELDALCAPAHAAGAQQAPRMHDPRIAQSLIWLRRELARRPSLAQASDAAGLSSGRYAHLFRAHTGMPLRPYLRWLRLCEALACVTRGESLTQAAHAAGFADSAHLTRSFRAAFGIAPSAVFGARA